MGWAKANRQRLSKKISDKNPRDFLAGISIQTSRGLGLCLKRGEFLLRGACIEQMEVGIDLEGLLDFASSLLAISEAFCDHSGMKQKQWILRSKLQGFLAGLCGFSQFAILVEGPRERIPCVNVMANLELFLGEIEGFGE